MSSSNSSGLLRAKHFCDINRRSVDPRRLLGKVFHYSIPAIEETGDGIYEDATEIESNKIAIDRKSLLVSRLNPEKSRVLIAWPHDVPTVCSTEFVSLSPREDNDLQFLSYVYQSKPTTDLLTSMTRSVTRSHRRVEPAAIRDLVINLPLPATQRRVATFLNRETAQASALVAKYQQLIDRLREKRVAVVAHAVTRGIDPDAQTRDSGIAWIGMIPRDWEILPFRHCGIISEGQVNPSHADFRETILIAPNHIESGTGRLLFTETAAEQSAISGKYRVKCGDIVYSKIRPALNKATIAQMDCLCSADMYPIRATRRVLPVFLLYSMLSKSFVSLTTEVSMRVAMPKVNRDTLASIPIVLPPLPIQARIVSHIDSEVWKIDCIIAKITTAMDLVNEHRSALITAAVTGQIDVHNYRAKRQQIEIST